eukprot:349624-Chlamydomonas_euryale.AAC.3
MWSKCGGLRTSTDVTCRAPPVGMGGRAKRQKAQRFDARGSCKSSEGVQQGKTAWGDWMGRQLKILAEMQSREDSRQRQLGKRSRKDTVLSIDSRVA